jgi:polyhydroxybutyrate depolymerase
MARRSYQILTPERVAEDEIRQRRKRRRAAWITAAALVIIAGGAAAFLLLYNPRYGQDITTTVEASGQAREFHIHLPPDFSPRQAYPAVILFHGFLQTGEEIRAYSQMDALADEEGFIVVYPLGFLHMWEVDSIEQTQVDDLEFVGALLDVLEEEYAVDPAAVYAAGYSQGGAFSLRLACQMSDRIAAFGSVAGATTSDNLAHCDPARPVPVILFHGTKDPVVPYLWTADDTLISAPDVAAYWAEANGCDPVPEENHEPDRENDGTRVLRTSYTGCRAGSEAVLYTIEGGTHTWPGAAPLEVRSVTTQDISANELLWAFFSRHRLP